MAGYDAENHTISVGDKKTKVVKELKFPNLIAPPEFSQEDMFNKLMMEDHIKSFMQGYSLNILAFG